MFERGPFISFANCGLPYHISGEIAERDSLLLQTPQSFKARFNVDVRINNEVMSINREEKTVTVRNVLDQSEYTESYDYLVLSPGAGAINPPIPGVENPLTHSLRNVPDMDQIIRVIKENNVQHATVVGGGFIGLEVMEAFAHLNIKTALVEFAPQVMTPVDPEMAGFAHEEIHQKGVDLRLGVALTEVEYHQDKQNLTLSLSDNSTLETDILVMAIGVCPDVTLAKNAGLDIGELGGISVNDQLQTNDPAIYAVGDAIEDKDFLTEKAGLVPLAGPANRQGRMVANNIFGANESYRGTQATSICKIFDLAVASVGKNEKWLKANNIAYEKVYAHAGHHAGYYPNAQMIDMKLIFDPTTGKILGAQAVGKAGVDKRIDVIAVAQRAGMTIQDLEHLELTYAPPFGNAKDIVNQIAFVAGNIMKGEDRAIHFDEVDNLTDDQILVDVRNPGELEALVQSKIVSTFLWINCVIVWTNYQKIKKS